MPDLRDELFRHHIWANERVLDACEQLTADALDARIDGVYGTIRNTLVHMFASEARYIAAIRNRPRPDDLHETKPFPGFDAIRASARKTGEELIVISREAGPESRMHGERNGEKFDMPLATPLAQAINHGTEHRTNITTIIAALGIDPPAIDVWQYARDRARPQNP